MNRRNFFSKAIKGGLGLAVLPAAAKAKDAITTEGRFRFVERAPMPMRDIVVTISHNSGQRITWIEMPRKKKLDG
jgi:hypothetical protein